MTSNVDSWSPLSAAIAIKGTGPAETPVDGIGRVRECPEAASGARSCLLGVPVPRAFRLDATKAGLCIVQSAACIKSWSLHVGSIPRAF